MFAKQMLHSPARRKSVAEIKTLLLFSSFRKLFVMLKRCGKDSSISLF